MNIEPLKIGAVNCHGIKDKVDYTDFLKLVQKNDIFGVTETWLSNKIPDTINIPGYKFYPFNWKKESGIQRGGIGVFIKCKIKPMHCVRFIFRCWFLWFRGSF